MKWLNAALLFCFCCCGTVSRPRQCNAESKKIPEQQPTTELSETHDITSQPRTCRSYPWWCKINSFNKPHDEPALLSNWLLMTFLPQWKARHGQIYVTLLNDNLQSSGEHANPLHNSSAHRHTTSSVSWSVFIRFGLTFWHFSAVELHTNRTLDTFLVRREVREQWCWNPIAAAGCGCCCTSVKRLGGNLSSLFVSQH